MELQSNSSAKDDFEEFLLDNFRTKYARMYTNVGGVALKTLIPFSSTYLCESGFSSLVSIKTKSRNKLDCEAYLRCALTSLTPRIKLIV